MTNQKDIAKKQAEIVGQLQQFPIGRTNSGGRAGGMVEVVVTNPLPGQPRVVQAKCANDCPPGEVQLLRADDGSYVALSRSVAQKTSETTTRQVSRKNPTIPKKNEEIWPCTVAFVYSKVKPNTEILTDNGATDITSYDYYSQSIFSGTTPAMGFAQRFDDLGDYDTAFKALTGDYKENRKLTPGGSGAGSGGAADNSAWGSAEGVIIWFYIGNPAAALTNGQIFKVSGPPLHPSAGNVTASGPGFAMEVYRGGVSSAIFPNENIGTGPLTKKVKESFPDLGGKIGYAGRIEKWRGVQDYIANSQVYYFRNTPLANQSPQTPVSYPPGYVIGSTNPWLATNASWYQFRWADPQYIGCASTSWINVETNAISAVACGSTIANSQWYWGGDASPSAARIDKDNPSGYIGTDGMFVCW